MHVLRIALLGTLACGNPPADDTGAADDTDTGEPIEADCVVIDTAAELVGPAAVSCGFVPLGDPLADAWSCAVTAFEAGEPFFIGWENHGVDTVQHEAMVYDGSRVVLLRQDQEDESPWRIDGYDCLQPYVGEAADSPYDGIDEAGLVEVLCADRGPPGDHYEVCGACTGCNPPGLPFVWP